jgi:hypothetical protein
MKNTKYMLIDAPLYDYQTIEERLTRMAEEGWHLEKVGNLLWKFRRGEPKQVRYAVTYAPSASAFNSRPTEAEEDLSELCAQAGWVRVANQAQRHIYRNENPNATPLETDEAERLKNIRKTMIKHFFPTEAVLIFLFLVQFFTQWVNVSLSPARTFSSYMMVSTMGMLLFVAASHGIIALDGALWLRRARLAVEGGEPIPENRFYRCFRWVMWAVLIAYLLCLLWTVGLGFLSWVLITSAVVLLAALGGIALCKQLNAPRWVNMVVPTGLCALAVVILIPILVFNLDPTGEELSPAEALPLTLTQLTGETGTERFVMEESSSFLCSYGRYWDTGADDVRITYTIVDVKCPLFYDMLLNEQEQQFMQSSLNTYLPIDGELREQFGAEYVRHSQNSTGDRWFICWDSRIVLLRAGWELTNEQLQIIQDSLMP